MNQINSKINKLYFYLKLSLIICTFFQSLKTIAFENIQELKQHLKVSSLSKQKLRNMDLRNLKFIGEDLSATDFQGSNLENANFEKSNLKWANFSKANLTYANFKDANLNWAILNQVNAPYTNFEGANLKLAGIENSNLVEANFNGANLKKVNINKSNISGAVFDGINRDFFSNFTGSYYDPSYLTNKQRTELISSKDLTNTNDFKVNNNLETKVKEQTIDLLSKSKEKTLSPDENQKLLILLLISQNLKQDNNSSNASPDIFTIEKVKQFKNYNYQYYRSLGSSESDMPMAINISQGEKLPSESVDWQRFLSNAYLLSGTVNNLTNTADTAVNLYTKVSFIDALSELLK